MALSLNGTSQYVSMADQIQIVQVRPITYAVLYETTSLRTTGNWNTLINLGNIHWYVSIQTNSGGTTGKMWFSFRTGGAQRDVDGAGLGLTITANTGWHLSGIILRDAGATNSVDFFDYRYSNNTLQLGTVTGATDGDIDSLVAGDHNVLYNDNKGFNEFYPGQVSWTALFQNDLGNGGSLSSPGLWELIRYGAWRMLDRNCKFFMPHLVAYGSVDLATPGRSGTLQAAPSWVAPVLTELPPPPEFTWLGQAAAAASDRIPWPIIEVVPDWPYYFEV